MLRCFFFFKLKLKKIKHNCKLSKTFYRLGSICYFSFQCQLQHFKPLPAYSAFYPQLHHEQQSAAIKTIYEGAKAAAHAQQHAIDDSDSSGAEDLQELNLGASDNHSERAHGEQTEEREKECGLDQYASEKDGDNDNQSKEEH